MKMETHVEEHRLNFEKYLKTLKRNCTVISKVDLNEIKKYLKAQVNNESVELSYNLQRRIQTNNFTLASFPSVEDVVCVLKTQSMVRDF